MKEMNLAVLDNDAQTMTSGQLAEMLGYDTKDINKKIRLMFTMEIEEEIISPALRPNGQVAEYHLPELQSKMFVAKNDINYLEKITKYWIDQKPAVPTNFVEALRLAADTQERLEEAQSLIKKNQPKVEFAESVVAEEKSLRIGEFAKVLSELHGIKVGPNKLMAWLRKENYLMKGRDKRERNKPYQVWIEKNYFEFKLERMPHGVVGVPYITGLGQMDLGNEIIEAFGIVL